MALLFFPRPFLQGTHSGHEHPDRMLRHEHPDRMLRHEHPDGVPPRLIQHILRGSSTVASSFRRQLKELSDDLQRCDMHFVRCIKANLNKVSTTENTHPVNGSAVEVVITQLSEAWGY